MIAKKIKLDTRESAISRILVIILAFAVLFASDSLLDDSFAWYFEILIKLIIVWIVYLAISFGKEVRLQSSRLQYGSYYLFVCFKVITEIKLDDVEEIAISQDAERYFEIVAYSGVDRIVIKKVTDKAKAKIELERIQTLIHGHQLKLHR